MLRPFSSAILIVALAMPAQAVDGASSLPNKIGICTRTNIGKIGHRLMDGSTNRQVLDSGSEIVYANGVVQVSYDEEKIIESWKVGDLVLLCLVKFADGCMKGEYRAHWYAATNLRVQNSWTAPNVTHGCNGL